MMETTLVERRILPQVGRRVMFYRNDYVSDIGHVHYVFHIRAH